MNLFTAAQRGDPDALSALFRQHVPLVQALSRRFSYSEDAFQLGCMGLVTAIRHYHADGAWRFSTYAVPLILGEMRRAFSKGIGWRAQKALNRAKKYRERALKATGQEPSISDAASAAGISAPELTLLLEWDQPPVCLDADTLAAFPDPYGDDRRRLRCASPAFFPWAHPNGGSKKPGPFPIRGKQTRKGRPDAIPGGLAGRLLIVDFAALRVGNAAETMEEGIHHVAPFPGVADLFFHSFRRFSTIRLRQRQRAQLRL